MRTNTIKYIEKIFRESSQPDELFDAFQLAVTNKINNIDLFKILLANPAISKDELKMYTEKLCTEFNEHCYDLFMWVGTVFENNLSGFSNINNALNYYLKAASQKPVNFEPYLSILSLYNYDIGLPINSNILQEIEKGIPSVAKKSKIYYALARHWGKMGNQKLLKKYLGLAEKSASKEN